MRTLEVKRFKKGKYLELIYELDRCSGKEIIEYLEDFDFAENCKVMVYSNDNKVFQKPRRADSIPAKWFLRIIKNYNVCNMELYYTDYNDGFLLKEINIRGLFNEC